MNFIMLQIYNGMETFTHMIWGFLLLPCFGLIFIFGYGITVQRSIWFRDMNDF